MRYSNIENAILVGVFEPNLTVTIKVLNLQTDTLVNLSNNVCLESNNIPGVYRWSTSNVNDNSLRNGYHNLFYEMTSSTGEKFYGKFIYGGYVDKDVTVDLTEMEHDHTEIKEQLELLIGLS